MGLPVGMLEAKHDPIRTATFNVDRRSTVKLQQYQVSIRTSPSCSASILSNLLQHRSAVTLSSPL